MQQCLNCGTALSCGCQKRTASNGAQVCANCLQSYELKLAEINRKKIEDLQNSIQNP